MVQPGSGAPAPQKTKMPWWVWLLIGLALLGLCVPFGAAFAIFGVRKYIANAKRAEAQHAVAALAAGIARCASSPDSGTRRGLPPTSQPVPSNLTMVRGKKYMSSPEEWTGDAYSCSGFKFADPQYFQYRWEKISDGEGKVSALADLDGNGEPDNGVQSTVTCAAGAECSAGPVDLAGE